MADRKIIDNYIYFYHLDKFCILPLFPETIQDQMQSSFQSTQALSRSAPVFTYSNSGPRSVNLNFTLHRDMMNDLNKNISNINPQADLIPVNGNNSEYDYIDILIKYLQSIALPKYSSYDNKVKGVTPPMVAVRLGDQLFIKGVVNSGITVTYKKPIINDKYAICDINFSIYEVDPYDAQSVVRDGSFRGISSGSQNNKLFNN